MSQPYPLTPPLGWVLDLLNEARKRAKSYGCGKVDYVYMVNESAQMGWDQRGAANEAELQQRADQELDACVQLLDINGCPDKWIDMLRDARRPKPMSEADQALTDLEQLLDIAKSSGVFNPPDTIRRALERLKKLEEATND